MGKFKVFSYYIFMDLVPVRILSMIPVKLHPLVPECKAVGFQSMLMNNIKKICWFTPFDASTSNVVFVAWGYKVSLVNSHSSQIKLIQPCPDGLRQVLFSQEDQLEVCLVSHIFQAADLKCLEKAGLIRGVESESVQLLQCMILESLGLPSPRKDLTAC